MFNHLKLKYYDDKDKENHLLGGNSRSGAGHVPLPSSRESGQRAYVNYLRMRGHRGRLGGACAVRPLCQQDRQMICQIG